MQALETAYRSEKDQLRRHVELVEQQLEDIHAHWYYPEATCPSLYLFL